MPFAFNAWILGEEALGRLGFTMEEATAPGFNLLARLGFGKREIEAANEHVCGTMTVEGAPFLNEAHLPVFDTANKCGKKGTRFIHYLGHIKMMSAAQSFLSGAISKTINMPEEATVDDILDAYDQSWHQNLKAMAVYRDGSKLSQPLSTKSGSSEGKSDKEIEEEIQKLVDEAVAAALASAAEEQEMAVARAVGEALAAQDLPAVYHRRLPARRRGFTQEARVAGHKVYLRTGEYDDGKLGEIFIDMHKEGAAFRSMINCFAIAISKGLQYGVPLEEFVDTFTFTRFEPQGMVGGHPNIKMATSIIDYVFRVLGLEYLGRTDLAQVPPELGESDDDDEVEATLEEDVPETTETDESKDAPAERREEPDPLSAQVTGPERTGHTNGRSNGNSTNYGDLDYAARRATETATKLASLPVSAMDAQLSEMMGDAPFCDNCGHITIRNGSCYKCLNCGNSLGCS
jgi:ribonucleoside-diphosphate reductase alpha chain